MLRHIFFFVVTIAVITAQDDGTIVQLPKGKVQGRILFSENGNQYYAFQEIPYAAPPVGPRRFQLPEEPDPWNGVLNTTINTKICIQAASRHDYLLKTEDCLYINVYTPVKPGSTDLLPVLLWIHGGGFTAESGIYEYYGPKYIIDSGVVVVSFNYRLGPFGFIGTDDGIIPLNLGLKDQRLAIQWVINHISLFGGNPSQITLVGESAGSVAVGYHMISQKPEEDLFHAAIMQSGSPVSKILKQRNSTENALTLGRLVDPSFTSSSSLELLTLLQNADANDILNAQIPGSVSVESEGLFSYLGLQAFIDQDYKKIPVLIGFNSEELIINGISRNETELEDYDADATKLLSDLVNIAPENKEAAGAAYKAVYTRNDSFINQFGGYIRYTSDSSFSTGIVKQVELSSSEIPYYFYQFSYIGELGEQMGLPIIEGGCYTLPNDNGLIVQIESGLIQGHILKSEQGNDYWAFQEIPYAEPPIGNNRFQLPQKPTPWDNILNTTKNTKICYQSISKYEDLEITEDCLYINVYTPVQPGTKVRLPVLFWIHGGGFSAESGVYEYYGPKYVMDHGVVIVTFNYRLGPFGFLGTDDDVIPRNLGLKDQSFALEWMSNNIHLFGGNSSQVTIVGESAGSIAVGYFLMQSQEDLFHAVIMQSGSPIDGLFFQNKTATQIAIEAAQKIDPSYVSKDTTDLLHYLQEVGAQDILSTGVTDLRTGIPGYPRGFPTFLNRTYKKIPVLIGFNSEEMVYQALVLNETVLSEVDADPSKLISKSINMSPENRTIAGYLYRNVYTNGTTFLEQPGAYVRYISDSSFTTSTCKQVELGSVDVPYYFYQFSYKGELGGQMALIPTIPEGAEQVGHAEDLHYMWDDGSNSDLNKFSEEDQLTLHRYVKMWTNFVKFFDPTPVEDPLLDNIKWLTSEPNTLRYLNINGTLEMRENPRQYYQLKRILEKYMEPPFNSFT